MISEKSMENIVLFVFMLLSVTIAASVALMLSQLFSSITSMYETAKPPHFLQMHMGDIDAFNESFEGVTYWQTAAMVDLYGDDIFVAGNNSSYTLSDCRLDISFVKQNGEGFCHIHGKSNMRSACRGHSRDGLEQRNTALSELLDKETVSDNIRSANVLRRVRLQTLGNEGEPIGVIQR